MFCRRLLVLPAFVRALGARFRPVLAGAFAGRREETGRVSSIGEGGCGKLLGLGLPSAVFLCCVASMRLTPGRTGLETKDYLHLCLISGGVLALVRVLELVVSGWVGDLFYFVVFWGALLFFALSCLLSFTHAFSARKKEHRKAVIPFVCSTAIALCLYFLPVHSFLIEFNFNKHQTQRKHVVRLLEDGDFDSQLTEYADGMLLRLPKEYADTTCNGFVLIKKTDSVLIVFFPIQTGFGSDMSCFVYSTTGCFSSLFGRIVYKKIL